MTKNKDNPKLSAAYFKKVRRAKDKWNTDRGNSGFCNPILVIPLPAEEDYEE